MILSSALIAGGIAYAAGDTFVACVNKSTGLTRIISGKMKCYKTERQVTWNQTGATGSQGATGVTGPSGTSSGVYVYGSLGSIGLSSGEVDNVLTVNFPSGKYIFDFSASIRFSNPSSLSTDRPRSLECFFSSESNPSTARSTASSYMWPVSGQNFPFRIAFAPISTTNYLDTRSLTMSGYFEFSEAKTVYLDCYHNNPSGQVATGQELIVDFPSFTATKVDTLTNAG